MKNVRAANARMREAKRDFTEAAVSALYGAVNRDADAVKKTTAALDKLNAARAELERVGV